MQGIKCPDILYKDFTINNVNVDSIRNMIETYKNENVVVELMTHADFIDEYTKLVTSYLNRESELNILKESKKMGMFEVVELINFQHI